MSAKQTRLAWAKALVALTLLAGLCATATPAGAANVNWVVNGRGFGHGVGMSAYGAYGLAMHGKTYRQILGHYFRGTALAKLDQTRIVRVLLTISSSDVSFSGASGACGTKLDTRRTYQAHRSGATVKLRTSSGKRLADCGRRLRAAGDGQISIAGLGNYRGAFEAVPTSEARGSLNVVNALSVDKYVMGVMPNESPPTWPTEELKAQAVASRSFALSSGVGGNGFDLYSDTRSQVYKGLDSEYPRTNRIAAETRGEVLEYNGSIAQTLFSACSGGHTESIQNVFGGPAVPYLQGVPDPYDDSCPLHTWTLRFSGPEISSRLGAYLKGRLKQVVITRRGASPRIVTAQLIGTGGRSTVTGEQLKIALGAYDTWMSFRKVTAPRR